MKRLKILFLTLLIVLSVTGTAFAEFKTIKDDPWFNFGRDSSGPSLQNTYVFESEREPVKIRVKEVMFKDGKYEIMAYVHKNKVFEKETRDGVAWKITEIRDDDSKRTFYIVNTQYGNDYVMGYDRENMKWQVYLNTSSLENPDHGIPDILVRNGRLMVQFKSLINRESAYTYYIYWDDDDSWLGCECAGYVEL